MKSSIFMGALIVIVVVLSFGYIMGWFSQESPASKSIAAPKGGTEYIKTDEESGEMLRLRDVCEALCLEKKDAGMNLSSGPCLGVVADDWVCDVAHDPRQDVDDDPENQCLEYGKTAHHFVEVDPKCRLIREA